MNYFEYFSEIEERFTRRRGSALLLSTLDWALIETWREAGVPLPAVLRGIDDAFDRYEARSLRAQRAKGRLRRVNGLAWCAQAVMQAAEEMAEAAAGVRPAGDSLRGDAAARGFEADRIAQFLERNAAAVQAAQVPPGAGECRNEVASRLRELGETLLGEQPPPLDELDRNLTVLEERLIAAVIAALPEPELLALRADADRELAPLRARLSALQLRPVREQFLTRRLLAGRGLPRLSLFYMGMAE